MDCKANLLCKIFLFFFHSIYHIISALFQSNHKHNKIGEETITKICNINMLNHLYNALMANPSFLFYHISMLVENPERTSGTFVLYIEEIKS